MTVNLTSYNNASGGVFEREIFMLEDNKLRTHQLPRAGILAGLGILLRHPALFERRSDQVESSRRRVKEHFHQTVLASQNSEIAAKALRAGGITREFIANDRPLTNVKVRQVMGEVGEYQGYCFRMNQQTLRQHMGCGIHSVDDLPEVMLDKNVVAAVDQEISRFPAFSTRICSDFEVLELWRRALKNATPSGDIVGGGRGLRYQQVQAALEQTEVPRREVASSIDARLRVGNNSTFEKLHAFDRATRGKDSVEITIQHLRACEINVKSDDPPYRPDDEARQSDICLERIKVKGELRHALLMSQDNATFLKAVAAGKLDDSGPLTGADVQRALQVVWARKEFCAKTNMIHLRMQIDYCDSPKFGQIDDKRIAAALNAEIMSRDNDWSARIYSERELAEMWEVVQSKLPPEYPRSIFDSSDARAELSRIIDTTRNRVGQDGPHSLTADGTEIDTGDGVEPGRQTAEGVSPTRNSAGRGM